ncbi:GcrA family cell cycle regulator [Rhodopseudomonas palustris]|nr:GcrA family cell cycle regulator [Rhodopseudomonas palustris]
MAKEWTDDRVLLLRSLVAAGKSRSEIAINLGVTINAVDGKIHRLGLAPGKREAAPASEPATVPAAAPIERCEPWRPQVDRSPSIDETDALGLLEPAAADYGPVEFLRRRSDQCATILDRRGSDGLPMMCGRHVDYVIRDRRVISHSYCAECAARYFTPASRLRPGNGARAD